MTFYVIATLAIAIGVIVFFAEVIRINEVIRCSVYDTSRFPLFAARDQLLSLVIAGKMREDDQLWQDVYGGVNDFLDQSSKMWLMGLCNAHLRIVFGTAMNRRRLREFQDYRRRIAGAAAAQPAFGSAMEDANRAIWSMCARRTPWWSLPLYGLALGFLRWVLQCVGQMLSGLAIAVRLCVGRDSVSPLWAFQHRRAT